MATAQAEGSSGKMLDELGTLQHYWGWFVALGVAMIVLGFVALGSLAVASLATALAFGLLLVAGGLAEVIGAFWVRRWSVFFLHLLSGVLSLVVGVLFLAAPVGALLALTLLLGCLLLVGGIFKLLAARKDRFAGWGWVLLSGILDVVLGVMIVLAWPEAALWVVGLFIGLNLVFRGVNWVGLGLALRALAGQAPWGSEPTPT